MMYEWFSTWAQTHTSVVNAAIVGGTLIYMYSVAHNVNQHGKGFWDSLLLGAVSGFKALKKVSTVDPQMMVVVDSLSNLAPLVPRLIVGLQFIEQQMEDANKAAPIVPVKTETHVGAPA